MTETVTGALDLHTEVERYFANDHKALRFVLSGDDPWAQFDPARVVASAQGRGAVRALASMARLAGWCNEPDGSSLFDLLRGVPLDRRALVACIGSPVVESLIGCGALLQDARSDRWNLGFGVVALGEVLAVVPRDGARPDLVYLGTEVLWLDRWRGLLGLSPTRVVDLGCGSGHLSAVLGAASNGCHVTALDLSARAVAMAALTIELNPMLEGRVSVLRGDLASSLRSGRFDLVVANPPWVPVETGRPERLFADGGPTGCELPLRFMRSGLDLLSPGGVLLMTTLDPLLSDGRRPILDALDALAALDDRWAVERFVTPFRATHPEFASRFLPRHLTVADAELVLIAATRVHGDGGGGPAALECWRGRCLHALAAVEPDGWHLPSGNA